MKVKFLLVILITISSFSCRNEKQKVIITPLNTTFVLEAKSVATIPEACYENVSIVDSLLVFTSLCDDDIFHLYNKDNLKFVKSFGQKGSGPIDFLAPYPYNMNSSLLKEESEASFFDVNSMQNKVIEFQKVISGEKLADCVKSQPLDENLYFGIDLAKLRNSKIAGRCLDESKGLFYIYDTNTKKKKWVDYYPKVKVDERYRKSLYYGLLSGNPEKGLIVHASRYFDQVLFYDLDGNLKREYHFSESKIPELDTKSNSVTVESHIYAINMYATEEYCYVFRANQSRNEIYTPNFPVYVLMFDWSGNLINIFESYVFPERFCVDEESKSIYFIKSNPEENDPFVSVLKANIKSDND